MAEAGYIERKNITYDIQNAEGDRSLASTIIREFVSGKVDTRGFRTH